MKAFLKIAIFVGLLFGGTALVSADSDPIKERKELMKQVGKNVGQLVGMMKGKIDYDAAKAAEAFAAIGAIPDKFVKLFPEGSQEDPLEPSKYDSKYYASDAVWSKMAEFKEKGEELEDAVEAAALTSTQEELSKEMKNVFDSCKGCHEDYRAKF